MYKVCVYAICKNEEQFVDRWMDAVGEADLVVVTDTGSTDHTVEKLRARGAIVYQVEIKPWRFDTARNISLSHIPEDVDICVSNDLDEIFEPGWREKLETAWHPCNTRASYLFTWSRNEDGTYEKQFPMQKIHRRHGFRWIHPVHEILEYNGEDPENVVWIQGLILNHYPDLTKPRGQYLPLLELSVKENPEDDRTKFWLGREYMYNNRYEECIQTLTEYLKMPTANWDEERCAAMRFIAKCYESKGDLKNARKWLYSAIGQCASVREPYLQLAVLGFVESDWPLVFFLVSEALKITERSGSYLFEAEAWGTALYDLGAISCYRLGLYKKSYEYAMQACDAEPEDARLKDNLEMIRSKLEEEGMRV